jgi:hypothetical protein
MNRHRKCRSEELSTVDAKEMSEESKYTFRRRWSASLRRIVASIITITAAWIAVFVIYKLQLDGDHGLTVAEVLATRIVSITEAFQGHTHHVTPFAAQQIQNYRKGTALIVNVHFTHHGGTFACDALGKAPGQPGSPSFACMGLKESDNVTKETNYPSTDRVPWTREETSKNIEIVRKYFHFIRHVCGWALSIACKLCDNKEPRQSNTTTTFSTQLGVWGPRIRSFEEAVE